MATVQDLGNPSNRADSTLATFGDGDNGFLSYSGYASLRVNGAEQIRVTQVANSVNYINITPSILGSNPRIEAAGVDTNLLLDIRAKGTGAVTLGANRANYFSMAPSAAGSPPRVNANGSDTDVGIALVPKGTGYLCAALPDNGVGGGNARGANSVDWQTLRTGATQVASGPDAVIGGGTQNIANSSHTVVAGGIGNTASGFGSAVVGGNGNAADGTYGWCPGGWVSTNRTLAGSGSWAAGQFAARGDAQAREAVMRRQSSSATPVILTSDNATPSSVNTYIIPNNSCAVLRIQVVGRASDHSTFAIWDLFLMLSRGTAAANTVVTALASYATGVAPTYSVGSMSAATVTAVLDTTLGGVTLSGVGIAATNISWVARISATEVAA